MDRSELFLEYKGKESNRIDAELVEEVTHKFATAETSILEIDTRLAFLKEEAKSEDESYHDISEQDFRQIFEIHPLIKIPDIYLVDGNVRAVWKSGTGKHLGLQFLGHSEVQFVIFSPRREVRKIARSAGRDSLLGIRQQISSFELHDLVYL